MRGERHVGSGMDIEQGLELRLSELFVGNGSDSRCLLASICGFDVTNKACG